MRQINRDMRQPLQQCGEFPGGTLSAGDGLIDPLSGAVTPLDRARALLGVRFRVHGRSAVSGVDCIGLAALTYGVDAPRGYGLRGDYLSWLRAQIAAAGLQPVDEPEPGDLLVVQPGPAQLHLAIVSPLGVIHADAGLRKVVERPGPLPWPRIGCWRRES